MVVSIASTLRRVFASVAQPVLAATTRREAAVDDARLRREGAVWSLVAFGALLLAASAVGGGGAEPLPAWSCAHPREVSAERGWTRVVACAPPAGGGGRLRGPVRWLFGRRVDLARADERLLRTLPGIGPARARDIVTERRRRAFGSVDDLERVHGIGPRTIERLRPFLYVDLHLDVPRALRSTSAIVDGEG